MIDLTALEFGHPPTYSVHGLRVRSEIPLTELVCDDSSEPDIEISWAQNATIPTEALNGRVLAMRDADDPGGYVVTEDKTGYTVRFRGEFDFRISSDTRAISVHPNGGADVRLASLLLSGAILAMVLELRGTSILHASCVETDSLTVALVGDSGKGKSTVTALLCADGARLVSDDALRVELVSGEAICYPGTGQIRLRPSAAGLAANFSNGMVTETGDGRVGINPARAEDRKLRVDAIVRPAPSRTSDRLEVRQLERREALVALISYPRVIGWQVVDPARRQFDLLARIIEVVPVFEATIPWGPPFPGTTARRLISRLEAALARPVPGRA